MPGPTLEALYKALASEIRQRIFQNKELIEVAQAIGYGEIKIEIVGGKISRVEPTPSIKAAQ